MTGAVDVFDHYDAPARARLRKLGRVLVKVTTTSGHNWTTEINCGLVGAVEYFMDKRVDVGDYPEERLERVTEVELIGVA